MQEPRAARAIEDFRSLRVRLYGHTALLDRMWALRDSFTTYEAAYLVLTEALEAMLVTIAESMEENADISVQRISSVIEPCVIVIMAVIVGFIMFATLMPILEVPNLTGL